MAPKKKEQQKMSIGDFLADSGFGGGSWADEVEETYVTGTQPLPASDRPRPTGTMGTMGGSMFGGYSRNLGPQELPDKPPYTAHLGNLSYDATVETVEEFFEGCDVANVRIIEDRDMQRPKGFGYVEFGNVDGLKKALTLDGESFQGRMIKIKIADPPRGGDSGRGDFIRDMGDWTRKGPLEPAAPPRRNDFGDRRGPSDFGERRASRDGPPPEGKAARDLAWERRGPLAPLPQEEGGPGSRDGSRPAPEGMGERSDSYRGGRRASPATWGEGRPEGSQGPPARREYAERPEKPERAPTAAEKDSQWRDRMRPDAPAQTSTPTSPVSPAAAPAAPGGRPRLNLAKRTVAEPADTPASATDSKASPFGAARPIDTATREKQVEEKRQQAIREKREADEKAKEERRLAKEAAAKAEEEAAANPPAAEATEEAPKTEEAAAAPAAEEAAAPNGATEEQKVPIRTREQQAPRDAPKPRGFDAGNWRSAGGERGGRGGSRGGPRGGGRGGYRNNENRGSRSSNGPGPQGGPASPAGESAEPAATQDEDGWTTVPKGRKGRA